MKSTLAETSLMGNMGLRYCGPFSKLSHYNHVSPFFTKNTGSNYSDIKRRRKESEDRKMDSYVITILLAKKKKELWAHWNCENH